MARPQPIAAFIDQCLGPALAAQGFAASDIVLAWPDIVGERLATHTEPLRIDWPRAVKGIVPGDRPEPATLVVRVTGAFALELQHCGPLVIERVNRHFGWRCVGRLTLRQGPVRRRSGRRAARIPVNPAIAAEVETAVAGVADEGLRDALGRLGRGVLSRREKGRSRGTPT